MAFGGEQLGLLVLGGQPSADHTIEQAVCKLLEDAIETRVVRRREQRGALPVITYRLELDEADRYIGGEVASRLARLEFRIWSETYSDLREIGDQIFEVLDAYHGWAWDREILTALHDGEEDDEEDRDDGSEGCIYVRALFYDVHYI